MDDISLQIRHCKRSGDSKLNLSKKNIKMVPVDLYQLAKVEVLDLSNNGILSIDPKITSMTSLKLLDISNNQLMTLPKDLLKLSNLQVLNVSGNPLSTQFAPLLKKDNQSQPKLQEALKACFSEGGSLQFQEESPSDLSSPLGFNYEFRSKLERPQTKQGGGGGGFKPSWLGEDEATTNSMGNMATGSNFLGNSTNLLQDNSDPSDKLKQQIQDLEELLAKEHMKQFDLQKEIQVLNDKLQKASKGSLGTMVINQSPLDIDPALSKTLEININELDIGDGISQGGFSIVHKGYYRGTKVAIKKVFNPNITPELIADFSNEIKMLATLRHPNIVLLMGICTKPPNLCIVTDFLTNGSLFNLLHLTKNEIKPQMKLEIAKQVASVLNFMHLSSVAHRDIKSHNVLLDDKFQIKICDFGLAREFDNLNTGTMQFSGTPCYMAPELFQKKAYDKKIDVFAFGSLLWEIFARKVPFEGLEPSDVAQRVMSQEPLDMQSVPKKIAQLVIECRAMDAKKRPDMNYILQALDNI